MNAPGWYPHPSDPSKQKYWDGSQWTDDEAPAFNGKLPPLNASEASMWNLLSTLGPLIGGFIAPLITYLVVKDRDNSVRRIAVAAFNGQIAYFIYTMVAAFSIVLLVGIILLPVVVIANLVFIVLSTLAGQRNEPYDYPLAIKFIKE